jgi:hypothetical protein
MKMQHKGQKYRKWRVIKFKREQARRAAELIPCWERDPDTVLAQILAVRETEEKIIGTLLGFPIYVDESLDVDYSIEFLGRRHNGTE